MSFLKNIEIEHYRGFYERRSISPALPANKKGSGLTVLVGPNNSGKSTVIGAIRSVARGPRQIDIEHRHAETPLILKLTNDSDEHKTLTNPDLGATTVLDGKEDIFPTEADILIVPSRRAWSPYTGTNQMLGGRILATANNIGRARYLSCFACCGNDFRRTETVDRSAKRTFASNKHVAHRAFARTDFYSI